LRAPRLRHRVGVIISIGIQTINASINKRPKLQYSATSCARSISKDCVHGFHNAPAITTKKFTMISEACDNKNVLHPLPAQAPQS